MIAHDNGIVTTAVNKEIGIRNFTKACVTDELKPPIIGMDKPQIHRGPHKMPSSMTSAFNTTRGPHLRFRFEAFRRVR